MQLVTVVGEPGIGKSRIVAELLVHAQEREPRLTWRQGRCLPYGDGVTFWALGEIVKAHAGILETDDPEQASTKLGNSVPHGPDREWMRRRLLPLVGVDVSSPAERDELFTAWRRFLETVAEQTPTVLVFEDLHWADDAMLAFLEHLADRIGRCVAARRGNRQTRTLRTSPRLRARREQGQPDRPRTAVGCGVRRARLRGCSTTPRSVRCGSRSSNVQKATRCTSRSSCVC